MGAAFGRIIAAAVIDGAILQSKADIAQDVLADNVGDSVVTLQIDAYPVDALLNRVNASTTTTTTTASTTETVKMDL